MRSLCLSLITSLFISLTCAASDVPVECADRNARDSDICHQPVKDVTTVTPGSFYVAKIACLDCPIVQDTNGKEYEKHNVVREENDLLFNISLSHDNRTILLNDRPVFPALAIAPHPPKIIAPQVPPTFSYRNLSTTIQCARDTCPNLIDGICWCIMPMLSSVALDYDYYSHHVESHPETQTEKWEFTFDAIGGHSGWKRDPSWTFNDTEQLMLRIIVQGKEVEGSGERYKGEKDMQAANSLFGPFGDDEETVHDLQIESVELMERSYMFPPKHALGIWGRIKHFFGADVVQKDGHIIYWKEEWGSYGKKGTLRNEVGKIIHDWPWELVGIIVGSVLGGTLALYLIYRLWLVVMIQRDLARWNGMDAVWEQLRRQHDDEEDEGLLHDGYGYRYRDDPDEGSASPPPGYTDEPQTNKPLPSKPLPEKPLPAVPLIDA